MNDTRTPEQQEAEARMHRVMNVWAQFGPAAFVAKFQRSRGWSVTVDGVRTPTVFKTKREAVAHADERVQSTVKRLRDECGMGAAR